MEDSQQLATESFSYSWLTDRNPQHSSDGILNNLIRPTFPENSIEKDQNFNFDVPFTASPIALVHADEIFSDGHIMPVYVDRTLKTSNSVPPSPISSSYSLGTPLIASKNQGKWKRILQKCFGFVKPLLCVRTSSRVDDLERKVCEVSNSHEASPRPSSAYSVVELSDIKKIGEKGDLCHGLKKVKSWSSSPQASPRISPSHSSNARIDIESSIHEAILYCKRSIEK